jgi:type IV secretion system protein VirD4
MVEDFCMSAFVLPEEMIAMRWTKLAVLPLIASVLFLTMVLAAPLLYPHVLHTAVPLWMLHLRQTLLPAGKQPIEQPYAWALLGAMFLMYLLVGIHERFRTYSPYGSARSAKWREARRFRASHGAPWIVRAPLALLRAPFVLAVQATWMLNSTRINRQLTRPGRESRFIAGTYRGRLIGLNEHDQEEHVLVVGPTGSRKSTFVMIGNLLREQGSRSLFIPDLKNELYRITAGQLAKQHQIWRFAPRHPNTSHAYNPLAYVKDAMDATLLAETWIFNTGVSRTDPFWSTVAQHFMCAVILHIRKTEPLAPFARVRDYIVLKSFEELKDILTHSPSQTAREKMKQFLNNMGKNERLVGSTMTDIGNRFQLFDIDAVRTVTAINEIDFNVMVDEPTALFLSIPRSEVDLYRPLMATFTMQMFRTWEQRAEDAGTLPRGIGCYMDEFCNIGYIPHFDHFITTARYLRVALIMVIQSFAQLDRVYGPEVAETIKDNANTHLLFPGAGLRECRFYSERIGDTTVSTWSRTTRGGGSLFGSDDVTYTEGQTRRRLFTPEELRTMSERTILLLRSALPPMMLSATPYYEDRSVRHLAKLPYHVSHIRQEPPAPAPLSSQEPPHHPAQPPPITVDADEDEDEHFLDEE